MNDVTQVNLMHLAPRCSARSKRTGLPCRAPAVKGCRVCRMHGARGGAPPGPRNGRFRTGIYSAEVIEASRLVRTLMQEANRRAREEREVE